MRGKAALLTLAASALAMLALSSAAGAAHSSTSAVTVTPAKGYSFTAFVVTFVAPDRAGRQGSLERSYGVSALGPSGHGCLDDAYRTVSNATAGERVHVTLSVGGGRKWCNGLFRGQVEEVQGAYCAGGKPCPQFLVLVRTIGSLSFRVLKDVTPPRFDGLQSAYACTPGPQRPGEPTPYTLTWRAALDRVTPSSKIVYDVFESSTRGGEHLFHPSWVTRPGVTTFRTPGLPSHGTYYFVVRARDQAGNEDRNRVERRGVDPCL